MYALTCFSTIFISGSITQYVSHSNTVFAIMHMWILFGIKIVRTFFVVETHCCVKNAKEFLIALIKCVRSYKEYSREFLSLVSKKIRKLKIFRLITHKLDPNEIYQMEVKSWNMLSSVNVESTI